MFRPADRQEAVPPDRVVDTHASAHALAPSAGMRAHSDTMLRYANVPYTGTGTSAPRLKKDASAPLHRTRNQSWSPLL